MLERMRGPWERWRCRLDGLGKFFHRRCCCRRRPPWGSGKVGFGIGFEGDRDLLYPSGFVLNILHFQTNVINYSQFHLLVVHLKRVTIFKEET